MHTRAPGVCKGRRSINKRITSGRSRRNARLMFKLRENKYSGTFASSHLDKSQGLVKI